MIIRPILEWTKSRPRLTLVFGIFLLLWLILWTMGHWNVGSGLSGKLEVNNKNTSKTLLVLMHGLAGDGDKLNAVKDRILNCHQNGRFDAAKKDLCKQFITADFYQPEYNANPLSNADPSTIAALLEGKIHEFQSQRNYSNIILIGHSMGDLLSRQAYLNAADREIPFEWSNKVTKIISMAGINRGWSTSSKVERPNRAKRMLWRLGQFIGWITFTGHMADSLSKGSPFVADLRVQWMRFIKKREDSRTPLPLVAQIIGSEDDVISREDTLDLGVSKRFHPFLVEGAGHGDLVDFKTSDAGERAGSVFDTVLFADTLTGNEHGYLQKSSFETKVNPDITEVIFVRHGIRDYGDWGVQFKRRYEETYPQNNHVYIDTSSYPRMPLIPFLLFDSREKWVNDFMDDYTQMTALFPNAERFHFVGHSNGTYLLARALQKYDQLKINKVVFAGTVTPRAYEWHKILDVQKRAGEVLNFVSKDDLVVGIFPRLFELIHELTGISGANFDRLGSAGYAGYLYSGPGMHRIDGLGGHSWAVGDENPQFDKMIKFIAKENNNFSTVHSPERPGFAEWMSNLCWLVWLGLVLFVAGGFFLIRKFATWLTKEREDKIGQYASQVAGITYVVIVIGLMYTV